MDGNCRLFDNTYSTVEKGQVRVMRSLVGVNERYADMVLESWGLDYIGDEDQKDVAEFTAIFDVILDMFEDGETDYRFRDWHSDDLIYLAETVQDLINKQIMNFWRSESMISALQYDDNVRDLVGQMLSDKYLNDSTVAVETFIAEMFEISRIFICALKGRR